MDTPTLHTLNKSAPQADGLVRLSLSSLREGDALLLIEDGVHMALAGTGLLARIPARVRLFVLTEDLAARGISARIQPCFARITYLEFVNLCLAHDRIVNWN
jgi:tRNA 2-thiouridine synthesizing protein B